MSTIVGIMDREGFAANTDNLVLVDPAAERLLWIPRDLWCETLGDRINAAFRRGGWTLLLTALREHDLSATEWIVFSRAAIESALAHVAVLVPIPAPMAFDYPLTPTAPIEEGSQRIVFMPPAEVLRGERVHQWIGARGGSDLHRIERQKLLVRRLLEQRFAFNRAVADADLFRHSGPTALADLAVVTPAWRFDTLDRVDPADIDGKRVLVRRAAVR